MTTVGITSFDGGSLKRLVDHSVHVPTDLKEYGPAEDAHMMINHLMHNYLTRLLKQEP
jgi:D-sedoheptulose 7-phosphate isomerase